jgi:hypothetical protein
VPDRGRGVYLAMGQKWDDILPCVSRRVEAVQENDRRTVRRHVAQSYTSPHAAELSCAETPPLRTGDGEEAPLPGHAFEFVRAAVLEFES